MKHTPEITKPERSKARTLPVQQMGTHRIAAGSSETIELMPQHSGWIERFETTEWAASNLMIVEIEVARLAAVTKGANVSPKPSIPGVPLALAFIDPPDAVKEIPVYLGQLVAIRVHNPTQHAVEFPLTLHMVGLP